MSTQPEPHTLWLDRRRTAAVPMPDWRRVLRVTAANPDGYVEGTGWWQRFYDGRWQDATESRRTRMRYESFTTRYTPVEEGQ